MLLWLGDEPRAVPGEEALDTLGGLEARVAIGGLYIEGVDLAVQARFPGG